MNYFKGQTKRPIKTKNERGITLVALIITIIILIILAAVTINTLTHDGLADLAIKSTQDYQKAQSDEMNMLNEIDTMVKETLKNIEDGTTKPKPEEPDLSEMIELVNDNIGADIDYITPAGRTFSTKINNVEYSGYSYGNEFSSDDIALTWKIWNIDTENIYLISDKATDKKLMLQGYTGYNNGVTLLDNLVDTLYSDRLTFSNMTARSIKLSDIANTRVLKDLISDNTKNINESYESKTAYSYNFDFPRVWWDIEQNDYSIEAREIKYNYNNSDPEGFTLLKHNHTDPTATQSSSSKLIPYSTYWQNTNMNQNSFNEIGNDNGATLYNLVLGSGLGSTDYYWLSSRYTYPTDSTYCHFGLQFAYSGGINYPYLYYYHGSAYNSTNGYAVRPIIQIPLTSCTLLQNSNGTFHIEARV